MAGPAASDVWRLCQPFSEISPAIGALSAPLAARRGSVKEFVALSLRNGEVDNSPGSDARVLRMRDD